MAVLARAQQEVEILAGRDEAFVEAAGALEHLAPHDELARHDVPRMREHFVHRGRLGAVGPRVGAHRPAVRIDFERECVDQRAIAIGVEDGDASRELLGHPFVVVVEERDVLAGRRANAGVARGGEAAIALRDDADAIAEAREHRGGVVGRAVVDDDYLVVGVCLREHAGQRAPDGGRTVVNCDDYRDARTASV